MSSELGFTFLGLIIGYLIRAMVQRWDDFR